MIETRANDRELKTEKVSILAVRAMAYWETDKL